MVVPKNKSMREISKGNSVVKKNLTTGFCKKVFPILGKILIYSQNRNTRYAHHYEKDIRLLLAKTS